MACIGIDLGTTYTCAAVWHQGHATVIANTRGNRTTPSWVAFRGGEVLIGESAKGQAKGRNAANTIYDSKRMIGRRWDDASVVADRELWPFKVVPRNHMAAVEVELHGRKRVVMPEQISAAVLSHMKEAAEAFLGREVASAVVTVPAYFNDSQRQATKHAMEIAGLSVHRMLNEPTAAAMSYGLLNRMESTGDGGGGAATNVLVFDFGGGTLDVTVLTLEEQVLEVLSTCGDTHLGGQDVDNNMMRYCIERFQRETGKDATKNAKAMKRVRDACQEAKHALSTSDSTFIEIEALIDGEDFEMELTLATFNEVNREMFRSTLQPVEHALMDAKMSSRDIHEIILIGGSTRIRKIQELLEQYFEGKQLCKRINPDEAVAIGAAIHAANLSQVEERSQLPSMILMDVTPMTLGIELAGGKMSVIVPRNSTLPYSHTRVYKNNEDNQEVAHIVVYEGEGQRVKDNRLLGSFTVENLPQRARGEVSISVVFSINTNGILSVSASVQDEESISNSITITQEKGLLTQNEVDRFKAELANGWEQAPPSGEQVKLVTSLHQYALKLRDQIAAADVSESVRNEVTRLVEEAVAWCDQYSHAHPDDIRRFARKFRATGRAIVEGRKPSGLQ